MSKKKIEEIKVGNIVTPTKLIRLTPRQSVWPSCEGVVNSINCDKNEAHVEWDRQIPKTPFVCEKCGKPDYLTVNISTQEIACFFGCGHRHGFENLQGIVPIADIELVSVYLDRMEKEQWQMDKDKSQEYFDKASRLLETARLSLKKLIQTGKEKGWT